MFRILYAGCRAIEPALKCCNHAINNLAPRKLVIPQTSLSQYVRNLSIPLSPLTGQSPFLQSSPLWQPCTYNFPVLQPNIRTVTKFSLRKGKRKSVKAALLRFYRLDWGIWIRTKAGRAKHLWRKTSARKRRLRQHVFCNATQSTLLDKMVTKFWKKPRYYVDDPYEPYHRREEFPLTRRKPI